MSARSVWFVALLLAAAGCSRSTPTSAPPVEKAATESAPPRLLSDFAIVEVADGKIRPAEGVIPYELNTPLFSDYAAKHRYVKLPPGQAAEYRAEGPLEFPVGTVIAKTFAYPHDLRHPEQGERLVETRILKREADGWKSWPYLWNAEQTEARLKLAGTVTPVSWVHTDGTERKIDYLVPNANQCKGCHETEPHKQMPVGPRADNLNRNFAYADGSANQLDRWAQLGALRGLPQADQRPKLPAWDHPETGSVDQRARAWLDVNCAHCHNPQGPARTSALDLRYVQSRPHAWGVMKAPVAAGRGSGDFRYDIVPGQPDQSILVYRISSTHPGIMMPELGKQLVHEEGVALVREWIASMAADGTSQPSALSRQSSATGGSGPFEDGRRADDLAPPAEPEKPAESADPASKVSMR